MAEPAMNALLRVCSRVRGVASCRRLRLRVSANDPASGVILPEPRQTRPEALLKGGKTGGPAPMPALRRALPRSRRGERRMTHPCLGGPLRRDGGHARQPRSSPRRERGARKRPQDALPDRRGRGSPSKSQASCPAPRGPFGEAASECRLFRVTHAAGSPFSEQHKFSQLSPETATRSDPDPRFARCLGRNGESLGRAWAAARPIDCGSEVNAALTKQGGTDRSASVLIPSDLWRPQPRCERLHSDGPPDLVSGASRVGASSARSCHRTTFQA
jgi:hypothetical protein